MQLLLRKRPHMTTHRIPNTYDSPWQARRIAVRLSQAALAERMGISRNSVSLIERGLPPTPEMAARLEAALTAAEAERGGEVAA
jgi:DNA-binding XRE family transcriptional regulator